MIYEMCVVVHPHLDETRLENLKKMVDKVVQSDNGTIFIVDDWGAVYLAQNASSGEDIGHFIYFLFASSGKQGTELIRNLKLNEGVLRYQIIKLSDRDSDREKIIKNYKTPYSKMYNGSAVEQQDDSDDKKDGSKRKKFLKRKKCWFLANNIKADWKDPDTYSWLINDFGKISPARVTGTSSKHQRFVTNAIKKARQLGIASFVSNKIAKPVGKR